MKISKRQLHRIIREERSKLYEDAIDTELDHLRKNVADDLDHIKDLHDDVEEDHEEELRAEKEKKKHESFRRRRRARNESRRRGTRKVGYNQLRRIIREQNVEVHHHYAQGYDAREDESLAAEHGGEEEHPDQDYKDRRDDAGFEVRQEALKRRLRRIVRERTRRRR